MSKQEIYSWCSLGFSLAILSYYLLSVFGWPPGLEQYANYVTGLIWKVIGAAVAIELTLDLLKSTKFGGVHKDERDKLIESKGFRNAYYFLMIALISLIGNVLISDFLSEVSGEKVLMAVPYMTFHALVVILFVSNIVKSVTQLYYYNGGQEKWAI